MRPPSSENPGAAATATGQTEECQSTRQIAPAASADKPKSWARGDAGPGRVLDDIVPVEWDDAESFRRGRAAWLRSIGRCGDVRLSNMVWLLLKLASYMQAANAEAWPSIPTLAAELGWSEPTVKRAFNLAVSWGWLLKDRRFNRSNLYAMAYSKSVRADIEGQYRARTAKPDTRSMRSNRIPLAKASERGDEIKPDLEVRSNRISLRDPVGSPIPGTEPCGMIPEKDRWEVPSAGSEPVKTDGLSDKEEKIGVTATEASQRQANSEDDNEDNPLAIDDDPMEAVRAFSSHPLAVRIVGEGSESLLKFHLRLLNPLDVAEHAAAWFSGLMPSRRCAFTEALAAAREVEGRLNAALRSAGTRLRGIRVVEHLDDTALTALLAAVAEDAGPADPRIFTAVATAEAASDAFCRRLQEQRAEQRLTPEDRVRRADRSDRMTALKAKTALAPSQDLVAALGKGDADLGARRAAELNSDEIGKLIDRVEAVGLIGAKDEIADATAIAIERLGQCDPVSERNERR